MMLKARRVGEEIVCGRPRCRGDGTVFGRIIKTLTLDGERFDFDLLGTMSRQADKEGVYFAERPFVRYARDGADPYHRHPERHIRDQESRTLSDALHGPFRAEDLPIRCRCRRCEWISSVTDDLLA